MFKATIFVLVAALISCAAMAAELPTRQAKPTDPPARSCKINGKPGFLAGDGQTCVHLGGYISGQVSTGNLK
jgi:hypothetical protein